MRKLKKVFLVIRGNIIKLYRHVSTDKYMAMYTKYLKDMGICLKGTPKYIDPSCYFDGIDYSLIELGKDVVISREVMLLTHDYSISRGFQAIGKYTKEVRNIQGIKIGENSFIGARASLLPGTVIGNNCIIGAGAVVKGDIPDGSIVVGNPAKIIARTDEWAIKKYEKMTVE